MKNVLVISSTPFSSTRSYGKTIHSLIQSLPKENVAQLYFNSEIPDIEGYRYFSLSDGAVFKSRFGLSKKGGSVSGVSGEDIKQLKKSIIPKTQFLRMLREAVWKNAWKSQDLEMWLDEFEPEVIFFVTNDAIFPYRIVNYIIERYHCRLCTYIADDYAMDRTSDGLIAKKRRKKQFVELQECANNSDGFFTISDLMREQYRKAFGKDSICIYNFSDSFYDAQMSNENENNNNQIVFVYAGSIYNGREKGLSSVAEAINIVNEQRIHKKEIIMKIYSNDLPQGKLKKKIENTKYTKFMGRLGRDDLKKELNKADVLVFVESFNVKNIEEAKYSFSTRIPEYLSLHKPILSLGPSGIGSIEFLKDCTVYVKNIDSLNESVESLLDDEFREKSSKISFEKYDRVLRKDLIEKKFIETLIGEGLNL